jgi:hypothetical protein
MVLWLLPQNPTLRFVLHKEPNLPLKDFSRVWIGMVVATIGENVSHTGQNSLLPMRLFIPNPSFRTSFRSLTTCRAAQIHTFLLAAPMVVLTNSLIGTEHRSWGWEHHQKRSHKAYPDNDNERRFVAISTTNHLESQKCDARSKDFQLFILSSE